MKGIGGSTAAAELAQIQANAIGVLKISQSERDARIEKAVRLMRTQGISALLLTASSSLYYFTNLKWYQSERLVGALLTQEGELLFICPTFEESKLRETLGDQAKLLLWEEDESPYELSLIHI